MTICPKCAAPVTGPSYFSRVGTAWLFGDLLGFFVTVLAIGVLVMVGAGQLDIAIAVGAVAGWIAYFMFFRRMGRVRPKRGLFFCANCQQYFPAKKLNESGAI